LSVDCVRMPNAQADCAEVTGQSPLNFPALRMNLTGHIISLGLVLRINLDQ